MSKLIPLTRGLFSIVDDDDFEYLSRFKWCLNVHGYAVRNVKSATTRNGRTQVLMHREIMGLQVGDNTIVDHINGEKLDNRKANVRVCTRSQNNRNVSFRSDNVSGYKGFSWNKRRSKWRAQIKVDNKNLYVGEFSSPEEAYGAYCAAAKKMHGDFHNLGIKR